MYSGYSRFMARNLRKILENAGKMLPWQRFFRLPSPVELGWSEYNALESREFSDETQGKTWEDWREYCYKNYPVRYFFAETLHDFLRYKVWLRISRPVSDGWYWLKCHTLPSYRYHMLDLRQPDYKYGWQDIDHRMQYAMFNLLNLFVKDEMPNYYIPTEDDVKKDPSLARQREAALEVLLIHFWWNTERAKEEKAITDKTTEWYDAKKMKAYNKKMLWEELQRLKKDFEEKEDDMFNRLVKVRRSLWT